MKAYLLVVALAVTSACGKQNDAHILQEEAVTLTNHYRTELAKLDTRVQDILKRASNIPGNLPDVKEVGLRLHEARKTLEQLKTVVGEKEKSPVKEQAETAAKANKIRELRKLVHDTEVTLEHGVTVVNAELDTVESWIDQYERRTLAMAPPAPAPEPAPAGAPATDPGAPPATEQPAAAQPTPAQPTPAPTQPAVQPKAVQPKAVQPKAVQPKAVQPKAVQPKAVQPKAVQPKAAQPKAAQPTPAQPTP